MFIRDRTILFYPFHSFFLFLTLFLPLSDILLLAQHFVSSAKSLFPSSLSPLSRPPLSLVLSLTHLLCFSLSLLARFFSIFYSRWITILVFVTVKALSPFPFSFPFPFPFIPASHLAVCSAAAEAEACCSCLCWRWFLPSLFSVIQSWLFCCSLLLLHFHRLLLLPAAGQSPTSVSQ